MKANPFMRIVALLMIICLLADPAMASARDTHFALRTTSLVFSEQAFALRVASIRPLCWVWQPIVRWWKTRVDAAYDQKPFEHLRPGEKRRIGNREYSIERQGKVDLYWSKPLGFKAGDPINVLNTGMSGLDLMRALQLRLPGMSAVNKYWRADGFATARSEPGSAVAQIVGVQSDLRAVCGKSIWQVADERVRDPIEAIKKHYPGSPIQLCGLSVGAALQICYIVRSQFQGPAVEINAALGFGEGAARWMRFQRFLRCLLYKRNGGPEDFIDALMPGTSASRQFMEELQRAAETRQGNPSRPLPPILMIATWTQAGIEDAWVE